MGFHSRSEGGIRGRSQATRKVFEGSLAVSLFVTARHLKGIGIAGLELVFGQFHLIGGNLKPWVLRSFQVNPKGLLKLIRAGGTKILGRPFLLLKFKSFQVGQGAAVGILLGMVQERTRDFPLT